MRSAFRGPAHQLAVRMRINNCTVPMAIIIIMAQATSLAMHHAPATARAPRVCTLVPFILYSKRQNTFTFVYIEWFQVNSSSDY